MKKSGKYVVKLIITGAMLCWLTSALASGIAWQDLKPEQQQKLQHLRNMWDRLPESRRKSILNALDKNGQYNAEHNPALKKQLDQQTEAMKSGHNGNVNGLSGLAGYDVRNLTTEEQAYLKKKWNTMSNAERQTYLKKLRHQPSDANQQNSGKQDGQNAKPHGFFEY